MINIKNLKNKWKIKLFIYLIASVVSFYSCFNTHYNKCIVEIKDLSGNVYQKIYFNKNNQIDSTIFVNLNKKGIKVCCDINFKPSSYPNIDKYLEERLTYPPDFHGKGRVNLGVLFNKNGQIMEIRLLKSISNCRDCSDRAITVIEKVEHWDFQNTCENYFCLIPVYFK